MPTLFRNLAPTSEPELFAWVANNQSRLYLPGRGIAGSLGLHGLVLIALILLSHPAVPRERRVGLFGEEQLPREPRFVMYLPRTGGGQAGKSEVESPGEKPQPVRTPGKDGMVYPGRQFIRSDSPDPTSDFQTLLQPELEDLPILQERVPLPNIVSIPDVSFVPPRPPQPDEPEPEPEVAEPEPEPVEPQPVEPDLPEPQPPSREVEQLPTARRTRETLDLLPDPEVANVAQPETDKLAVGLAEPEKAEDQQPIDPSEGVPVEPIQMEVEDLPTVRPAAESAELLPTEQVTVAQPPPPPPAKTAEPARAVEQVEPEIAQVVEETAVESSRPGLEPEPTEEPRVLEPEAPVQLPIAGTKASTLLSLTPAPTLAEPTVEIPRAESRGRFTISPEASPESSGTEPGVPSTVTLENWRGDPGTESGSGEDLPSVVTVTFGRGTGTGGMGSSSGAGGGRSSGSGSETGSGSGAGSGTGKGSGAGTGSGSGPFSGITIVGGVSESRTAGSGGTSADDRRPLSGIRVIGGAGEPADSEPQTVVNSLPFIRIPPPVQTQYGLYVVSTEDSGGGLPYMGVFSGEQIQTVFLDMREDKGEPAPFWPLEFAAPREIPTRRLNSQQAGEAEEGFMLPLPVVKPIPSLPADLVAKYPGKMIIVYALINAEGKMEQLSVKESPDLLLNEILLSVLRKWVFRPGTINGVPVPVKTLMGVPLSPAVAR